MKSVILTEDQIKVVLEVINNQAFKGADAEFVVDIKLAFSNASTISEVSKDKNSAT